MSTVNGDQTVVGDYLDDLKPSSSSPKGKDPARPSHRKPINNLVATDDYTIEERPFFVPITKDGVIAALERLDQQLVQTPTDWAGREVAPGQLGLINHGQVNVFFGPQNRLTSVSLVVILRSLRSLDDILASHSVIGGLENGLEQLEVNVICLYSSFKSLMHNFAVSDTVIEFQGLTVVQVSQNQAAVVSDPQNQIFVIKNSGFVAFAVQGTYDVLSIVDQTHLPGVVKDRLTGVILGWTHEVKMKSRVSAHENKEYVVATFLNIPASNCAILQRGDDLELLGAGQSVITNPSVTLRGLYTLGENQLEMPTKDIFTRDQVPVSLTIYLKWQLTEPLKLTTHGYNTPYDALRDKTQSILTQIVAHLDYSAMVKQRSLGPDNMEDGSDPSSAFLDALRTRAMDEMHEAALEYGIILKDLAVIDRQFKGEIASTMDKLTTRALQAQVEAANVDRENSNKVKQEEGALSVAKIKAQSANAQADAEAYKIVTAAKAQAQRTKIEAEAQAEATRLAAQAEAEAVRIKARADAEILDQFAREMQFRRTEIRKVQAYGSRTVFVPADGPGAQMGNSMAVGMAAALGADARRA
ncbi:hypothetical protein H0H92_003907 [Tricholoma furcatifolium]|nr:hypothetical protein H0H92_003907 [Tricholoma furcatifolium]